MKISDDKFYSAKISVFLLLVVGLFAFNGCSGAKITEPEVQDFLKKIEVAVASKDADAIVAGMSEKVQIKATVTAGGQTQNLTFTREQYRDFLKKSFVLIGDYKYARQNTQVKVSSDGKSAVVTEEISETTTLNGQTIRSLSTQVASLVIENGKIVTRYIEIVGKQV